MGRPGCPDVSPASKQVCEGRGIPHREVWLCHLQSSTARHGSRSLDVQQTCRSSCAVGLLTSLVLAETVLDHWEAVKSVVGHEPQRALFSTQLLHSACVSLWGLCFDRRLR